MVDAPAPTTASAPGSVPASDRSEDVWKPEPRQWAWKDLFTIPMTAFRPTSMVVSALTILALSGLWHFLWPLASTASAQAWPLALAGFLVASVLIFSLGATLVSTFFKADLLDDEYLSLGEGLRMFGERLGPTLFVPTFMMILVVGLFLILLYGPGLIGSIPWGVGASLYALCYVLAYPFAIFLLLVAIAVVLGVFIFPAIIAIRRHGWFDNVVDTVEAVGTRPQIMVASIVVTGLIIVSAWGIAMGGMMGLKHLPMVLPGTELAQAEQRASAITTSALHFVPTATIPCQASSLCVTTPGVAGAGESSWYMTWFPGLALGIIQTILVMLILGYCLNLFLAGGMVTYLVVREDDYWDEEDLQGLDTLAKELEDQAKAEEAANAAAQAAKNAPTGTTGA